MAEIRVDFTAEEVTNKQGTKHTGAVAVGDVVLINWPVSGPARETRVTFASLESFADKTLSYAGKTTSGPLSGGITLRKPPVGGQTAVLTVNNGIADCIIHAGVQLKRD